MMLVTLEVRAARAKRVTCMTFHWRDARDDCDARVLVTIVTPGVRAPQGSGAAKAVQLNILAYKQN